MASHISWSSYCASQRGSSNQQPCLTSFLPLFKDDSKSGTILCPGLDIIKRLTFLLNPTQNSVVTMDEPLYAITKQVQWCFFSIEYGKDNLVVLLWGLHEEKASFSMLGVITKESGWVGTCFGSKCVYFRQIKLISSLCIYNKKTIWALLQLSTMLHVLIFRPLKNRWGPNFDSPNSRLEVRLEVV